MPLTFDDLVRLEPRLEELAADVAADGRRVWFAYHAALQRWARVHKPRLKQLVGWYREPAGFHPPLPPRGVGTAADCVAAAGRFTAARAEWVGRLPPDRQEVEAMLITRAAYAGGYNHLFPLLTGERAYASARPLLFPFLPGVPTDGPA
ncbi:MAG: hypothetical protein U0871_13620 [Gemmataceae bacterium]